MEARGDGDGSSLGRPLSSKDTSCSYVGDARPSLLIPDSRSSFEVIFLELEWRLYFTPRVCEDEDDDDASDDDG